MEAISSSVHHQVHPKLYAILPENWTLTFPLAIPTLQTTSHHKDSTRNHTLVVLDSENFPPLPHIDSIFSPETRASKIVYRGTAHGLGAGPLLLPLVRGKGTSYVFDGKEDLDNVEDPYVAGTQAFLVSGFQGKNNARVVVTSSLDMFSDEY
jgi:oligosaccharyltransferase complex subunit beta